MAQFGSFKFGEAKFGASTLQNPFYALEVDWNRDGLFDGTAEGRLVAWGRTVGRQHTITPDGQGFEEENTGRLWFVLQDPERRYDARNSNSPLHPMVSPGAEFRLRVRSVSDVVYALGRGFVTNVRSFTEQNIRYARLECSDLWSFLRLPENEVSIDLQEGVTAGDAIAVVLDKTDWRWGRDIESGIDVIPYWWASDKSAAKAIHEVALAELGKVTIDASGTLHFGNRYGVSPSSGWIVDDVVAEGSFQPLMPWEVVKNRISVRAVPLQEQTGEVWKLTGTIILAAGEETDTAWCRYTWNGQDVAAKNGIEPVAGVDYTANSQADGGGADMTSALSVSVYYYASQAAVRWKNTGGSTMFVTSTKLRADAIAKAPSVSFVSEDFGSQAIYQKRSMNLRSDWYQNVNQARLVSQIALARYSQPHEIFRVTLSPNDDVTFVVDLGKRFDVLLESEQVYGAYRVIQIVQDVDIRRNDGLRTSVLFEPYESVENNAQLPVQIPFQI